MSTRKSGFQSGEQNPNWKGGRFVTTKGYIRLSINGRKILEHRYVMEQHLGRPLKTTENVHHLNGDKTDNRIENLKLIDHAEHAAISMKNRIGDSWSIKYEQCVRCKTTEKPYGGKGLCKVCYGKKWRKHHPGYKGRKR